MLLAGKRIFIVEDNLSNRTIMQLLLEKHGAVISFERWGRETCQRLRAFAPVDLILMDLMFPNKVTGYDIFDTLRATADFAHIPIVAVSACDPSEAIPKTQAKGFAGFIAKPVDFYQFPKQIATLIKGGHIWMEE